MADYCLLFSCAVFASHCGFCSARATANSIDCDSFLVHIFFFPYIQPVAIQMRLDGINHDIVHGKVVIYESVHYTVIRTVKQLRFRLPSNFTHISEKNTCSSVAYVHRSGDGCNGQLMIVFHVMTSSEAPGSTAF